MNLKEEIKIILQSELGHAVFPAQEKGMGVLQHKEKHIERILTKIGFLL